MISEFKVGDWIVHDEDLLQFSKVNGNCGLFMNSMKQIPLTNCKLWKPQEGEWCVFWDNDKYSNCNKNYQIARFGISTDDWKYSNNGIMTKHIAPLEFIQTLKDSND